MDPRQQRGLMIVAVCKIDHKKDGLWTMPSQAGGGRYWVRMDLEQPTCTCKDFEARQQKCKHVFAVEYVVQRESNTTDNGDGTETETVTETVMVKAERVVAKRKTYKQVWPAYNKAQTNEKDKFQVLLAELCQGIVEPDQEKGRPRVSLRDAVFAAVFKIYSTVSKRRFMCDLSDAQQKGHIGKVPHYNTIFKYLEMPGLTSLFKAMIGESSLPLRSVEKDFAVDSTGFTSSRFIRWFDHKYGQPKQEHDWVKVHLMTGVKTNVVTAVEIGERNAHDCPEFKPLFKETVGNGFRPREVSADAAYLSHENMNMVGQAGGTPYILFKSNTTAAGGGLMAKMFHLYNLNRDDYLSHYHKRSNVETTKMIKSKFGDSIRSKTDTAMVNEALAKLLCHNLCCLIQSHYELGINATFWGKEDMATKSEATEVDPVEAYAWV